MLWIETVTPSNLRRDAEKALSLPVGLTSPLWLAFGAAAASGVAFWWMSRLGRPVNLEAAKAAPRIPLAAPERVEMAAVAERHTDPASTVQVADLAPHGADDLTALKGVGPRIASALAERGVVTFQALANWSEAELEAFDAALNLRGRGRRDDWIGQARARLG
ncbi:MAG: hypothetical protein KGL69_02950 [Alphaproteobacteria bacterium]|nr:hypothetical protein [Alphaproteobacteria bacterium]